MTASPTRPSAVSVPPSWSEPATAGFAFEDFPGTLLAVALWRVHRRVTFPLLAPYRIGLSEWRVLTFVAQHGPIAASDIAGRSTMDKGQISRAVRELEARGWVTRAAVAGTPARYAPLVTTAAGRRLFRSLFPKAQAAQAGLLEGWSRSEREAAYRVLRALARRD